MASWANETEVIEAIKDLRNDNTATNWCVVGYPEENVDKFVFKGKGSGGLEEMKAVFTETSCYYALLRVTEVIELSTTVKFVFIKYLGERMKPMLKAKVSTHMGAVQGKLKPYHVEMFAEEPKEVTEERVMKLVSDASMSVSKVLDTKVQQTGREALRPREVNSLVSSSLKGSPKSTVSPSVSSSSQNKLVSPEEEKTLKEAIFDVRNDTTETDWVLAGYVDAAMTKISLVGKGTGGMEALREHLREENIFYGMVRATDVIDKSVTVKFCFVHYLGNQVKPMAKARTSTHKGAITDLFTPYHVDIFTSDMSELTTERVNKLVSEASNSGSRVLGETKSTTTTTTSKPVTASRPTPSGGSSAPGTTGLEFDNLEQINEFVADVRNDRTESNWCLLGYTQGGKKLAALSKGTGGADELATHLDDSQALYGLIRTTDVIDESITIKFCFVNWLGRTVSPMLKARISTHKGAIEKVLSPYHVTLTADEKSEVTQQAVDLLVAKTSMSHSNVLTKN